MKKSKTILKNVLKWSLVILGLAFMIYLVVLKVDYSLYNFTGTEYTELQKVQTDLVFIIILYTAIIIQLTYDNNILKTKLKGLKTNEDEQV